MKNVALVIMAKEPRAGLTKTRLCPPFSYQHAAEFAEAILLDTLDLVNQIKEIQLAIAITPPTAQNYFEKIIPDQGILVPVEGHDIGECIYYAMTQLLSAGYKKVIALNADGPSLPIEHIYAAIKVLDEKEVVLGPGEDGGYYLIGVKKIQKNIFKNIEWSTDRVFKKTIENIEKLGLSYEVTPSWYDIDTASDVQRLYAEIKNLQPDRLMYTRRFFDVHPINVC